MVRATSTNSRSRTENTWPRVSLAKIGVPTIDRDHGVAGGLSVAVIASARTRVRNASGASMQRMMMWSTLPPKWPGTRPLLTPSVSAMLTEIGPAASETRVPGDSAQHVAAVLVGPKKGDARRSGLKRLQQPLRVGS